MKALFAALIVLVLAGVVAAVLVSQGAFTLPIEELEANYTTPDSRFVDVDGVRVHYMDQGSGPVVVLLHASFMSLRTWDSMVAALATNYRVIRLDRQLSGLTGADPRNAYSVEREIQLMEGLLNQLGVEKFALLGTSSGGTMAFRYAAANPDRVTKLILINSAGMPRTAATNPNRPRGSALGRWIQKYYRSESYWRKSLSHNFPAPHKPPEWLIEMTYDMNRRAGLDKQAAVYMQNFRTGDPETLLGQITAPTLVLWGMENATVMHLEADVFAYWLRNAPVTKKKFPEVGHYMYLEIPEQIEAEVRMFLDGDQVGVTSDAL